MKRYVNLTVQLALAALVAVFLMAMPKAHAAPLPYVMAIFFMDKPTEYKPYFVAPMPTLDACLVEAAKKNATDAAQGSE